jgi:wyosine [tRNA(Phe)-imidazoG37] synthetase (radical SAM superfamily)
MSYRYLFGPVPSRRLGVSLGIDLVPAKTCTYDCIYCECGKTTKLTVERKSYAPVDEILRELDEYLARKPQLDYITFSGSGEPTLHSGIGIIARHLKDHHPEYRVALLTNGSLFGDPAVRDDVKRIDVIIPSLDAATEATFRRIDRPSPCLSLDTIIGGLERLREEYAGQIWLEIFIVPDINDTDTEIAALNVAIKRIRPDKIQLNTLDRPGVVAWITAATPANLERVARAIDHPHVEVTGRPSCRSGISSFSSDILESMTATLRRRPCTVEDLSRIFGMHPNEINKYVQVLLEKGLVVEKREERGIFFAYAGDPGQA